MDAKFIRFCLVLIFLAAAVAPAGAPGLASPLPHASPRFLTAVSEEVTKTVTPGLAFPGDTVTYQINLDRAGSTPGATYTITDAIPAGLTVDPASISATSGSFTWLDNTLTWTVPAPPPEYDYAITTIDTDPLCTVPYINLADQGISPSPAIAGNNMVYSAFTSGLPFDFYGMPYTGLGITDDGIIVFDPATHYAGTPGTPQTLPDPTAPNNLLALLWQDMEIVYNAAAGRGVSLAELDANTVVVEFDEIQLRSNPANRYTFELIASRTPSDTPGDFEFVFAYHRLTRPLTGPLTVGVENHDSSLAQAYVNNAGANNRLRNPFIVCLDRIQAGPPASLTYTAAVTAAPRTTIVNSAIIVTDPPGSEPDNADATLTIGLDTYLPVAGTDLIVNEGTPVQFTGSLITPDLPGVPYPTGFTWDFGDGSSASGSLTPTHTYSDNGVYTAALTISDSGGVIASDSLTVTVHNVAPQPALGADAALVAGDTFSRGGSFTDPGADSWTASVDYGDGSGSQVLPLSGLTFALNHLYSSPGAYTLTVSVTDDDGGQGQASIVVMVYNSDTYMPDAGPNQTVDEGDLVQFAGSLIPPDMPGAPYPTSLTWDFGDGAGASASLTPSHTYTDNGVYTATLTAGGASGPTGSDSAEITVQNVAPAFDLGETPSLFAGETFNRTVIFSDPGADTWTGSVDYGDGSGMQPLPLSGMSFDLAHAYAAVGTYTLTVTINDDDGGSGSDQLSIVVVAPPGYLPAAGEDQTAVEGAVVQFAGSLIDPVLPGAPYPTSFHWDFGDGSSATGSLAPAHVYADNGEYLATFTILDGEGAEISDTLLVSVANAIPTLYLGGSTSQPQNTAFSRFGSFIDPGADSWTASVDYGDGLGPQPLVLNGNQFSLYHHYLLPGEYTLTVVVTDDDGGAGISAITIQVTGYRLLLPTVLYSGT